MTSFKMADEFPRNVVVAFSVNFPRHSPFHKINQNQISSGLLVIALGVYQIVARRRQVLGAKFIK